MVYLSKKEPFLKDCYLFLNCFKFECMKLNVETRLETKGEQLEILRIVIFWNSLILLKFDFLTDHQNLIPYVRIGFISVLYNY